MFIKNGVIDINEKEWLFLNEKYTKEEIKKMISDSIEEYNVPLPYRDISVGDCLADFCKMKINKTTHEKGEWFTRYDYKYGLSDVYFPNTRVGNKSSDYFHQENRWLCDSINSPSPYRTWTTEKFRLTLLNALWTLKVKKVDMATLRSMIGLRKYIASQFRPNTARLVYNTMKAENVLDFSSGWGDRLAGFCVSDAKSYVGVDPNARLKEGYEAQKALYGGGKDITMIEGCAEDIVYDRKFDTVFTSPPYFNIERYTQEGNQSFKKFKKIDQWLEGFMFPALENAWNALESDGTMIINISDVYSNHTVNNICDPMNDYISENLKGSRYMGAAGYQMAKRPNSGALKGKTGMFCEPMWIWKKA